ncbi:MAG: hypothetical protein JXB88_18945 [Spirochaetales bacterium]|nr:hypothetical protein [Spirochaetales bacterium]
MKNKILEKLLTGILKEAGSSFKPFKHIIREILREHRDFDLLRSRKIIELGPGDNFTLIEYLSRFAEVEAAGLSHALACKPGYLKEEYIYDYLASKKQNSSDLIYSRRLMEEHSLEAPLLLKTDIYKRLLSEGPSDDLWLQYPGSRLYLIRCYKEARRVLKTGGIIISHVGNRFKADFHESIEKEAGLKKVIFYSFRLMGQMWVFRK